MRDVWPTLALAIVAGLFTADPGDAQEYSCPDGWRTADLGFTYRAEIRSIVRAGWDRAWPRFGAEPVVTRVETDGPASGVIREGDAISAVAGLLVTTAEGSRRLGTIQPGDPLKLSLRRAGRLVDAEIVAAAECVEKGPAAPSAPDLRVYGGSMRSAGSAPDHRVERGWIGISAICAPCGFRQDESGRWYPYSESFPVVRHVEPGSPADEAGIQVGDEVRMIDGHSLKTDAGSRVWWNHAPGDTLRLTLARDLEEYTVELVASPPPPNLPPEARRAREYWSEELVRIEEEGPTRYWGVIQDVFLRARGNAEFVTIYEDEIVIETSGESTIRLRPRRDGDDWWGLIRPPPPEPPTAVKAVLRNAVKAQEAYHARHGTYSSSVESLGFHPDEVSVAVDHADDHSYVMVATYGEGVWCVSKHGGYVEEGDKCGRDDPDLAVPAVRDLRNAMTAQEAYYARHKSYSSSVESLDFRPEVRVAVTHADNVSYVMEAMDGDNAWCVSSRDGNIRKGNRCGEDSER